MELVAVLILALSTLLALSSGQKMSHQTDQQRSLQNRSTMAKSAEHTLESITYHRIRRSMTKPDRLMVPINFNITSLVLIGLNEIFGKGGDQWKSEDVYLCDEWLHKDLSCPGCLPRNGTIKGPAECNSWSYVISHTNPNYNIYYQPKYLQEKGYYWKQTGRHEKMRMFYWKTGKGRLFPMIHTYFSGTKLAISIPSPSTYNWKKGETFCVVVGIDISGADPLSRVCFFDNTQPQNKAKQTKSQELDSQTALVIDSKKMTWRDQLAVETGYDATNTWIEWIRYTAEQVNVRNCFICAVAKPNLATHPVSSENITCLLSLFDESNNTSQCGNLSKIFPVTRQPTPINVRAYKGNYTCFRSNMPNANLDRGEFPKGWCNKMYNLTIKGKYNNISLVNQTVSRADLLWLCGDMKIRQRLSGIWTGECALVSLIMPFRIFRQNGVEDPADVMKHHRWSRSVKPGGSFDKTIWIDGIGVPRGVPDEFKARNQIAAGFESVFFWWATINKNVDWINYLYYNQQRFVNFTVQAVEGLRDQLDKTSLMTIQNRMALDMLLADKGGVCHMIGTTCCTFIPNNTAPDGTVSRALEGLKALSKEWEENSGIENPFTKWLDTFFGSWKGMITQLAMAVCVGLAIMIVCGCCCVPCIKALMVKFINTVIQKGVATGTAEETVLLMQANGPNPEAKRDPGIEGNEEEYWP